MLTYRISIIVLLLVLFQCKSKQQYGDTAYLAFYREYSICVNESSPEVASLDKLLKRLSTYDADIIRKTLIEFNQGDGEWLARFSISNGIVELKKDGTVRIVK